MNLNYYITKLEKKNYFIIIFIIAFSIGIVRLIKPDNILITGFIIASRIIYIYIKLLNTNQSDNNYKYNSFVIKPDPIILEYPDIIDFLYDLKEYYEYDMLSFNDLIIEINSFFILYKKVNDNCKLIYDNLLGLKLKILNILSNYIYSIPYGSHDVSSDFLIKKIKDFDNILETYLKNINCNLDEFKTAKPYPSNIYNFENI
jgi:hypothetical protein